MTRIVPLCFAATLLAIAQPPSTPAKSFAAQFEDTNRRLLAMAKDFPESKYDYRATKDVRPRIAGPKPCSRGWRSSSMPENITASWWFTIATTAWCRPNRVKPPTSELPPAHCSVAPERNNTSQAGFRSSSDSARFPRQS